MPRRSTRKAASVGGTASAPAERHRKFVEENKEWDRRVEESLTDLDRLADEDGQPEPVEKDAAGV